MTKRLLLALGVAMVPGSASATVSAMLEYVVPYEQLQTDDVCLMPQTMVAELGIPGGSIMWALTQETHTLLQTIPSTTPPTYVNINLLATEPPLEVSYVWDGYDNGVMAYSMHVDLSGLAQSNGYSADGRARTARTAKLLLIAMATSLHEISNGLFHLWVTFDGLPSQWDLDGVTVYPQTFWPYTAGSSLLRLYTDELINQTNSCPADQRAPWSTSFRRAAPPVAPARNIQRRG